MQVLLLLVITKCIIYIPWAIISNLETLFVSVLQVPLLKRRSHGRNHLLPLTHGSDGKIEWWNIFFPKRLLKILLALSLTFVQPTQSYGTFFFLRRTNKLPFSKIHCFRLWIDFAFIHFCSCYTGVWVLTVNTRGRMVTLLCLGQAYTSWTFLYVMHLNVFFYLLFFFYNILCICTAWPISWFSRKAITKILHVKHWFSSCNSDFKSQKINCSISVCVFRWHFFIKNKSGKQICSSVPPSCPSELWRMFHTSILSTCFQPWPHLKMSKKKKKRTIPFIRSCTCSSSQLSSMT